MFMLIVPLAVKADSKDNNGETVTITVKKM